MTCPIFLFAPLVEISPLQNKLLDGNERIKFSKKPHHVWNTDTSQPKKGKHKRGILTSKKMVPSHLVLFSVKDQNQKKRQTLTNEQARWYKIGYIWFVCFSFETDLFYITLQKKNPFFSKKFPSTCTTTLYILRWKKMNKKPNENRFLK